MTAVHTIGKSGGAGTLGYNDMIAVTQILETLLGKLRRQELTLTAEMSLALQEAGEIIAQQSAIHREGGKVDSKVVGQLCARLEGFLQHPTGDANGAAGAQGSKEDVQQNDDPNYGFFGGAPKVSADVGEHDDDFGFFKGNAK